jgi:copper homeostasis protein
MELASCLNLKFFESQLHDSLRVHPSRTGVHLMRTIVFELCAETIEACLAAREGGANRIELCSALSEGGLTPSHGLIAEAVEQTGLPIHVMLRPRGGDFVYSEREFAIMVRDLVHMRGLSVSGIVLGILHPDNTIDVERTAELVALAAPMQVTFHRAFDQATDLSRALEEVIRSGCHRVLTSGGEHDVESGAGSLARLVAQANGRIDIAVGGGLRIQNASAIAQSTSATHFHGSLRRFVPESTPDDGAVILEEPEPGAPAKIFVDSRDVQAMIRNLSLA